MIGGDAVDQHARRRRHPLHLQTRLRRAGIVKAQPATMILVGQRRHGHAADEHPRTSGQIVVTWPP